MAGQPYKSEQEQTCESGIADHPDGVDLQVAGAKGRGEEKRDANPELPGVFHRCREVFLVAEQEGGSSEQTDDGRSQTGKHRLYQRGVRVFHEHTTDQYHQYQRG